MKTLYYKRCIVIILFFVCVSGSAAQTDVPVVIPPSPNAAAFAKYGNIPVSMYTGVAQVSIPLYEIRTRDIVVPIYLSYHGSGIKVAEEASRVGLGWVLNCGGVITRTIIGMDDFLDVPEGFLSTLNQAPAIPEGPGFTPLSFVQGGTVFKYLNTGGDLGAPMGEIRSLDLKKYLVPDGINPLSAPHDFQPDRFSYNFLGNTGTFVLNKDRRAILEKQEKIRITPLTPDGASWEVVTSDGFIYEFLDSEYLVVPNGTPGVFQRTAWYLTEIRSPRNEVVRFHYSSSGIQYIKPVGSYYERLAPLTLSCSTFPCRGQRDVRRPVAGHSYSNITLDSITWSNGRIAIVAADDRLDVAGDSRVRSIEIYKKGSRMAFQEIIFLHEYFTSSSSGPGSPTEFPTENPIGAARRLKLSGVTKRAVPDLPTSQPEEYFFTYHEEIPLPVKNSFARDHWGYANGRHGNTSLLPSFNYVSTSTSLTDVIGAMGNERDASPSHAQGFSLKSIQYPTKGKTTFYYSGNDYNVVASEQSGVEESAYPETTSFTCNGSVRGVVQTRILDLRDEYLSRDGTPIPVMLNAAFRTKGSCDHVLGVPDVFFELYRENNLLVAAVTPGLSRCSTQEDQTCISCDAGSPVFTYRNQYVLAPGIYYWKAFIGMTESQIIDVTSMYTWWVDPDKRPQSSLEPDGSLRKYKAVGGLRISKIEDYDPESDSKFNVRRYEYQYMTDQNPDHTKEMRSYGKLLAPPKYCYFDVSMERREDPVTGWVLSCLECLTLIRDSHHPLISTPGPSVGYDQVIEYQGENGENGYTIYEFENYPHHIVDYLYPGGTILIQPPTVAAIPDSRNGNPRKQTHFSASGVKVRMVENRFESGLRHVTYAVQSRRVPADSTFLTPEATTMMLIYQAINSNFSYLAETKETSYRSTGEHDITILKEFFYENPEHLQLTREVAHQSDLHKTITTYSYPADYTEPESNAVVASMKGPRHMHSLPVQITVTDEGPDGGQKVTHSDFNVYDFHNGSVFMKEKVVMRSDAPLTPRPSLHYVPSKVFDQELFQRAFTLEYNDSQNLSKVQKEHDVPVGYLWGYSNCLPVAEVKNASAEEAFYTSFEDDGKAFTGFQGNNLAKTGIKIRDESSFRFPETFAPVETNTLMSYFYWQDDRWNFSGALDFHRDIASPGTKLDEVRAYPKDAQMTTFSYEPLVGVTTITDPNGTTTYYDYDEMGRLKLVRDDRGRILKSYQYFFKR